MTAFGVSIWLFQQTGRATTLTWAAFSFMLPLILVSIFAGTIVDRYDRKRIMMLTDLVAGATTIVMLVLLLAGTLSVWQVYALNFVNGAFNSLQWPAFSAALTMMIKKEDYARANGLVSIGGSGSNIIAPAAAAAVLAFDGLRTILIIDIVTFVVAVGALLLVHIPNPPRSAAGSKGDGSFWQETKYGFAYIFERRSLLGIQTTFMVTNFFAAFTIVLLVPLILARTNNNEVMLGTVQSIGAVGGVIGGFLLTLWGGPKRKIDGVLGGMIAIGLLSNVVMGFGRNVIVWSVALFIGTLIVPILNGSNQAIWQAKVAPDIQGRVFSVRRLIAWVVNPLATALAGPLADTVFEPAMQSDGVLAGVFGRFVGTGPGAGIGLMFVLAGLCAALAAGIAYFIPFIRNAETLLPDHTVNLNETS